MPSAAKSAVAPLYLLACLLLGGSAQGIWQNMVLQLVGAGIIAWAALEPSPDPLPLPARRLLLLAIVAIAVIALQQVPLPASLWAHGPRGRVVQDYQLLGHPASSMSISLTPYESLSSMFGLIPPLAMFCAIVQLKAFRPSWLAAALLGGTATGVILGGLQVVSSGQVSSWYLYADTSIGVGVGFFANANHMASLLVFALPFIAAIAAAGKSTNVQRYSALLTVLAALTVLLVAGIALSGSLAGYLLAVPVIAASALILLPPSSRWRHGIAILAALAMIVGVGALTTSELGGKKLGGSVESRSVILKTTSHAISDFMPLGSGLGSFLRVYRLYESPESVTSEYVIHAHNDYAELALELGIPGIVLMLLFLGWWAKAVGAVWRKAEGSAFTRAATIATAAVLIHSLVDFPLRTAAIDAAFAMGLALMADRRPPPRQDAADLRPTRHLVVI